MWNPGKVGNPSPYWYGGGQTDTQEQWLHLSPWREIGVEPSMYITVCSPLSPFQKGACYLSVLQGVSKIFKENL